MSVTQYKTIRIAGDNYSLEITMDSQNEQKLKCALRCFQKIDIDGFAQPVTVYPVCIIDNTGANMDVIVDITHKVEVEEAVAEEPVIVEEEEVKEDSDAEEDVVDTVPIVPDEEEEDHYDDDFVVEDPFIGNDDRWKEDALIIEEVKIREAKKVEDLLSVFNKQIESIMQKLDTMKQKQDEEEDERPLPPIPSQAQEEERPLPLTPPQQEKKPHPPPPPKENVEQEKKPHPPHHAPKIEIVEEEANIRASEFEPHPPPSKPHPPKQPPPQKVDTPLNTQIVKLQKSYDNLPHIDKNIVRVILDHMKCIEQFNLSGVEKKAIVLSSIETILANNPTAGFILDLSSQLIDTFIAFDKDKINITEKKLSALSCFPPCK